MVRSLSRLGLLLWAGLHFSPLLATGEAGAAASSPTVSEREGSALVARAPALVRAIQLQDHGSGSGALPLPFPAGAVPIVLTGRLQTAVAQPYRAVAAAVRASNYPTGPPIPS